MKDLIIGVAKNFSWPDLEPFAVSVEWSRFSGDRVLFVENITDEARENLVSLKFQLIQYPKLDFPEPQFFLYAHRFYLIHRYLTEHADEYRFVFCVDTRDLVFQHNPSEWMEKNIGDKKLVAASEFLLHQFSPPNMGWVRGMMVELSHWIESKDIYCSGFVSGRAEYISDVALAIYFYARAFTKKIWGSDQPIYNTLMHQKAYAEITKVPSLSDHYCVNLVNVAFDDLRINMHDTLQSKELSDFVVLHQYDRMLELQRTIRSTYRLAKVE